jgi:hypothetical protein
MKTKMFMRSSMEDGDSENNPASSLRAPSRGNQMIIMEHQQAFAVEDLEGEDPLEETKEPVLLMPEIMITSHLGD